MKILIVQIGRIGDMVLVTPMFAHLKKKYPQCIIHVLCTENNHPIIYNDPRIDKVFNYKNKICYLIKLFIHMRSENYDYWIDNKDHYSLTGYVLATFSNAKQKIGFNNKNNKLIGHWQTGNAEIPHFLV